MQAMMSKHFGEKLRQSQEVILKKIKAEVMEKLESLAGTAGTLESLQGATVAAMAPRLLPWHHRCPHSTTAAAGTTVAATTHFFHGIKWCCNSTFCYYHGQLLPKLETKPKTEPKTEPETEPENEPETQPETELGE